ncbi:MAG TPA: carboxypeptidase-like regulatory domain-containing protein [Pirellulaceae bacterium]|nr:carboxypeptidase-like regulatory domain-containing protein [Pirellulaceae bacterium]
MKRRLLTIMTVVGGLSLGSATWIIWGGQDRFEISGKVTLRGEGVPSVFVSFHEDSGTPLDAAMTDDNGGFQLRGGLAPGTYRVAVFPADAVGNGPLDDGAGSSDDRVASPTVPDNKYWSAFTSGITIEVRPDADNTFPIALD